VADGCGRPAPSWDRSGCGATRRTSSAPSIRTWCSAGARVHWGAFSGFLAINNVLDDTYETSGTFAPNAKRQGAPIEPFVTPAMPIHLDVGLAYRF